MLIKPIKKPSSELGQCYSFILCTKTPSNIAHKEEVRGEEGRKQKRRKKEETMGNGREIRQIGKQRMSDNKQ